MDAQPTGRNRPSRGPNPLRGLSAFTAYLVVGDLAALIWSVVALLQLHSVRRAWGVLVLLIVLALAFEEGARRAARLRLRLSADLKRDMTSVWCITGAAALPPGYAVMLLSVTLAYIWFRQQRPAGEAIARKFFNASTVILGCLVANAIVRSEPARHIDLPWLLAGSVPVVIAIVVYTLVNRALVTIGLVILGARGKALIGSVDDNLIELATLCLGGLVALAALHQPWLAILVLAPMYTLQRGALVRELESAAMNDAKTGLLNAIAWEQVAVRELARAEREGTHIAVVLVDIDRFKLVNDRYGHLVGDVVLREVGQALRTTLRGYDAVGRFGGEEFVAVLPETGEAAALAVAERIRAQVNALRVSELADGVVAVADDRLAVSIGVSCLHRDGVELPELLYAADGALYEAKRNGRNQVRLARRDGGSPWQVTSA